MDGQDEQDRLPKMRMMPMPNFFRQSRLHIPGKQYGNCLATCVANLLGMKDYGDIPQLEYPEEWDHYYFRLIDWLLERDLALLGLDGHPKIKGYYIASGMANRGVMHACIYSGGKLVWDPHPDGTGLHNVEVVEVLADLGFVLDRLRRQKGVDTGNPYELVRALRGRDCTYGGVRFCDCVHLKARLPEDAPPWHGVTYARKPGEMDDAECG